MPYRQLIANGLPAVMAAHVVFPEVDSLPASLSPRWIGDILRRELGFRGAVLTDDLSMAGAAAFGGVGERARLALAAGCDVLLVCNDRAAVLELLATLSVESDPLGQIRRARLHGRAMPDRESLFAQSRWQAARRAADQCLERPELRLDA